MPSYEFRCEVCSSKMTILVKMENLYQPKCPSCEIPMNRVYEATPAIFKGSGWGGSKK